MFFLVVMINAQWGVVLVEWLVRLVIHLGLIASLYQQSSLWMRLKYIFFGHVRPRYNSLNLLVLYICLISDFLLICF